VTEVGSPQDAWRALAGARVLLPSGCGFPTEFVGAIDGALTGLQQVEIVAGLVLTGYGFLADLAPHVRLTTWQYAPGVAAAADVSFLPLRYSQIVGTFGPGGAYPVDALVLHLSPPDAVGHCTLGVSPSYLAPLAARVPRLIGVVNEHMPATTGHRRVHVDQLERLVRLDAPLPEFSRSGWDEVDLAVARNVAGLVEDGATLQIGLGGIPEALLQNLSGHRDLGLYGMLTDGAMRLMEAGVVTGARYTPYPGAVEVGEVMGGRALAEYAAGHDTVRVVGADYAMHPDTFARVPGLVAVNSAIEVDLGGQVNAETVGHRIISGAGGQCDYMQGAMLSPGGRSVIAMRSTARGGRSRIVSALSEGSVVTTPRTAVTHVATEHGVATLVGRTLSERAAALAAIADPAHRDELLDAAKRWN
jgi:4-hydroxybutyrate CoA-transferase